MTQIPEQVYGTLRFLFSLLDVSEEEAKKEVAVFERVLQLRAIKVLAQRLGENDKTSLVALANKVGDGEESQETLQAKIKDLFNEQELARAFLKEGEVFFQEVLKEEYTKATEEQKSKIEEMFKKEVLHG